MGMIPGMKVRVLAALLATLAAVPAFAAPTVTAGVGVSGIQVGTVPALAVTPHLGIGFAWDGWTVAVRDSLSLVPGGPHGLGVNNVVVLAGGYRWPSLTATVGLSLAQYALPACSPVLCAYVLGIAPGVDGAVDWFSPVLAGALGVRAGVSVGWYGGRSAVLPGGPVVMLTAGPVLRFGGR